MIEFRGVSKVYDNNVKALNDINVVIERGEFVFLVGPSGAGKSTFIKMLLKEVEPSEGSIVVNGTKLEKLKRNEIPYYRRKIGMVFQDFRLIQTLNVYENVAFAMRVIGAKEKEIIFSGSVYVGENTSPPAAALSNESPVNRLSRTYQKHHFDKLTSRQSVF